MSSLSILLIIEFAIFLIAIWISNMDFVSPGVCAITVFFFATILLKFVEDNWQIQLKSEEMVVITVGLLSILAAEYFTRTFRIKKKFKKQNIEEELFSISVNTTLRNILIGLSVIFLGVYILEIYRKGVGLGGRGLLSIGLMANSLNDGTEKLSFLGKIAYQYDSLIAYPFCWLFAKSLMSHKKFKEYGINLIPIICCLCVQFFAANRHNMLRVVLAVCFCCYILMRQSKTIKKRDKKKITRRSIIIFAVFLFLFYIIRDVVKVSVHRISFFEYIVYYLSSPIVLFGKYLANPFLVRSPSNYFGETCFTGFYATLMRWGIVDNVVVETNHSAIGGLSGIRTGNTYTFFMRPFHDFGLLGVVIVTFLVFLIACYFYHKVINKGVSLLKGYRKKMTTLIIMSYFYYMFPLTISDFYITIESKIMTVFYLIAIYLICRFMIKVEFKQAA